MRQKGKMEIKCPLCQKQDNLEKKGVERNSPDYVYVCKYRHEYINNNKCYFSLEDQYHDKPSRIENTRKLRYVKCPICNEAQFIRFQNKSKVPYRYSCNNKKGHPNNKLTTFRL